MDCYDIKALKERLGELKNEMLELKTSVETEERSFSDGEFSKWEPLEVEYNNTRTECGNSYLTETQCEIWMRVGIPS